VIPPSRDTNPFSSCWLGPAGVEYVASDGNTPAVVTELLAAHQWRGQIVGNHGVGKSTLLGSMKHHVLSRGREWIECRFYSCRRPWPVRDLLQLKLDSNSLLVIDGYEQLGSVARAIIRWRCWRSGAGLLVTTHEAVELPLLVDVRPNEQTAIAVFRAVVAGRPTPVTEDDAYRAFHACKGDIRQMLDKLYDQHERHERADREAKRQAKRANGRPPRRVPTADPPVLLD
jgi:hypothetical protein